MLLLTSDQIQFLLSLIKDKYGQGYSDAEVDGVKVGVVQVALSVGLQLEAARKK